MKKRTCISVAALLLAGMLLFCGCDLLEEAKPYLDFRFSDYLTMTDGVLWGIPCAYSRISSDFGYRNHPITGEWSLHKGIDLVSPEGTPIYASRSGVIAFAGWDPGGGGNYVSIDHQDGYKTQYLHMVKYIVEKDQVVEMGEIIGYVGSTGVSTGPHLHFVIRKWNPEKEDWDWVNPNDYLDFHK